MAISPDDLQRQLCDQLCAAVRVERRPNGELMLAADFEFPDGDRYPIYLSETPGGVPLSDKGDTLTRISYDHDIDAFLAGSRGAYSDDADHQFRQADHRFRSMPITLEERRSIGALRVRVFGVEV